MNNFLSMDEIKNATERPEQPRNDRFIFRKGPDRKAASERYYIVQDILYDWHGKLNDSNLNTREMPKDLLDMYDQASELMVRISMYERKLSE